MKISIVTPCYNAEKYIAETVESIVNQTAVLSGQIELEYIICDGASKDRTVEIVRSFDRDCIQIISEPDRGMYDALAKGLRRATGEIIAYLNAGDYYHKRAFGIVAEIFQSEKAQWLTGYDVYYNEESCVIAFALPYKYRRALFACGYYDGRLPMLQQESTFWTAPLMKTIDWETLAGLRYAGDYYLWRQFATVSDLKIVQSYLGGFKKHEGQISENMDAYLRELRSLSAKPRWVDRCHAMGDRVLWYAPPTLKKRMNAQGLLQYDIQRRTWL